jgi:hypothetical protein
MRLRYSLRKVSRLIRGMKLVVPIQIVAGGLAKQAILEVKPLVKLHAGSGLHQPAIAVTVPPRWKNSILGRGDARASR